MRRFQGWLAVVTAGFLAAGCVGGSKGLSSEDKDKLKAYVLDAPPADIQHRIDVNFENKIHLIGYKLDTDSAKPGQEVKITYYWRCDDPLDEGWLLFTHTKDEGSGKMGNLDYAGPLREERNGSHQVLGPERWEKGKIYVDEQTYKIPDDVTGSEITVYTGIWKGDARLRIISGPNDGDNSAIVGKIKTGIQSKPPEEHTTNDVPSLIANKVAKNDAIKIDGKGDEVEWGAAASTPPFVDVGTGKPNSAFAANGSAKVLWDDHNLYILVQVRQADLYTGFTDAKSQPADFTAGGQPKLWTKDTIEMMVEPDAEGTNKNYYELQINPQNKVFKSQFDTLQQPNGGANGPFGHEDWDPKLTSAVQIQKGPDGKATGYTVEAAIPWAGYTKAANHPPKPGEVWRVNFYAMKQNAGVAWSPILGQGTFHKASRFGKITWAVPGTVPAGSASSSPIAGAPSGAASTAGIGGMPHMMPMPRGPVRLQPRPQ
jgi:hypothetical protein